MTDRKPIDYALDSSRRDQVTVVWEGLTMLDAIGKAYELPAWDYKCVQVLGELAGADMEGSLDGDHWAILHNRWTHEELTSMCGQLAGCGELADIAESPRFIRPHVRTGDERGKVTVKLFCRRSA